jgi:hypothetical protein
MGSIFLWLITSQEAFIGLTIKLETEDKHAASKGNHQIEQRCSGGLCLEEG